MHEIVRSYRLTLAALVGLSACCQFLLLGPTIRALEPALAQLPPGTAVAAEAAAYALVSVAVYSSVCTLGLFLFRTYGWRRLHPRLVFEGEWETAYTYDVPPDGRTAPTTAACDRGVARVQQEWDGQVWVSGSFTSEDDCGASFAEWESVSFTVQVRGPRSASVVMTYLSKRMGASRGLPGGVQVRGVEELVVVYDEAGRPLELRGSFYNYVQHPRPRSGHVLWVRRGKAGAAPAAADRAPKESPGLADPAAAADRARNEQLERVAAALPKLAAELAKLGQLIPIDPSAALNKMRFIAEGVLVGMCRANGLAWKGGRPTIDRMVPPLEDAGVVPNQIGAHLRTVQVNASPGSHYQDEALSYQHVDIALPALVAFLRWYAQQTAEKRGEAEVIRE